MIEKKKTARAVQHLDSLQRDADYSYSVIHLQKATASSGVFHLMNCITLRN